MGPAIFSRVVSYSMNVITQAFVGHLGYVELAAISIANTVIDRQLQFWPPVRDGKSYHMLGIYLQRSWIVLFLCCFFLPFYVFATPLVKLLGQPDDVAESSGIVACWLIPLHFSFAFQFPLQRFLQSQLKNSVIAWLSFAGLLVNALTSWLFVDYVFEVLVLVQQHVLRLEVSIGGEKVQEKSIGSACLPFPEGLLINGCGPNCYVEDGDVSPKFFS